MKKNYRPEKEPPQIAVKFANMAFVLGILYCVLTAVYASYRIFNSVYVINLGIKGTEIFYIISIICGVGFATLFGFGLKRFSNNLKVNLSVLFFVLGITVFGFETYLGFSKITLTESEIIAKQMGIPYDTRTRMEVLDDLRDSGVEAYPSVGPGQSIMDGEWQVDHKTSTDNDVIYNLGGISNITTIYPNESGFYPIIETDEHGFNNPKGLYKENNVDIVLSGDSFTEGYSVHSNETISAVLRQLNFNAISVGMSGNGSLKELASLKEYAEPLKPKIVLWVYFEDDIYNLIDEMNSSSLLKKYLNEDDYSQNLISRQEEIDEVLKNYAYVVWEQERERGKKKVKISSIINLLKLSKLRKMISLATTSSPNLTLTSTPITIFRDILLKSKQMVSEWDGKMYLVYLPAFEKYSAVKKHPNRDFVMSTAIELDIPIIDIRKEVFDPHPDPLSLFPFRQNCFSFRMNCHYNAEGYRLVGEAIGKQLDTDGYVPIKDQK